MSSLHQIFPTTFNRLCYYRKRLESVGEEHEISKIDESTSYRTVEMPTAEENLGMRMEVPPWAEAYEVSTTDADGKLSLSRHALA